MKSRLKVSIYGGCVSRDILNYDDNDKPCLHLVNYNARSSIATLGKDNISKKISDKYFKELNKIESNFQRRMVEADFRNDFIKSAKSTDYDLLLIDFLVDRFHLAEIDGKLVTRSVEFVRSGIKPSKVVNTFSDEFLEHWYKGVSNFLGVMNETRGLEAVRVNKVYWADTATKPEDTVEMKNKWSIDKQNDKLDVMYSYIEKLLPKNCMIEVPNSILIANSDHKWGFSPFHYIDDYYYTMLDLLKDSYS